MKYEVMVGFDTDKKRFEAGDVLEDKDIPSKSKKWLQEQGIIEKYIENKEVKRKRARNDDGSFKKDNKSTPDINEAWVEEE